MSRDQRFEDVSLAPASHVQHGSMSNVSGDEIVKNKLSGEVPVPGMDLLRGVSELVIYWFTTNRDPEHVLSKFEYLERGYVGLSEWFVWIAKRKGGEEERGKGRFRRKRAQATNSEYRYRNVLDKGRDQSSALSQTQSSSDELD